MLCCCCNPCSATQVAETLGGGALQSMTNRPVSLVFHGSTSNLRVDSLKLPAVFSQHPACQSREAGPVTNICNRNNQSKNGRHLSMGILCHCDFRPGAKRRECGHLQHLGPWCRVLARSVEFRYKTSRPKRSGRRAVIGLELPVHKGPGARD